MKVFLLINVKMPIIVSISIFVSRKNGFIGLFEHEKEKKAEFRNIFIIMSILMSCSSELSIKKFYNLGAKCTLKTCNLSSFCPFQGRKF